jgi:hypothetical protein
MPKRKSAGSIVRSLKQSQEELSTREHETVEDFTEAVRAAFGTLDAKYIEDVARLAELMRYAATRDSESKRNALRRNAGGLTSILEKAVKIREKREAEPAEETEQEETAQVARPRARLKRTPVKDAAEYLRSYDSQTGKPLISIGGYRQRLYAAARDGKIRIEDGVVIGNLKELASSQYEHNTPSSPRKTAGVADKPRSSYEQYATYRTAGHMSPEEVRERHPEICPPGKDVAKFFGALEGCFRRYRSSRRKR